MGHTVQITSAYTVFIRDAKGNNLQKMLHLDSSEYRIVTYRSFSLSKIGYVVLLHALPSEKEFIALNSQKGANTQGSGQWRILKAIKTNKGKIFVELDKTYLR